MKRLSRLFCFFGIFSFLSFISGCTLLWMMNNDSHTIYYTVTFDSCGGSEVASQKVAEKTPCVYPAVPVKEGFSFEGWYYDTTYHSAVDFSGLICANVTFYAKWNPNSFKITLMNDDEEVGSVEANYGENLADLDEEYILKAVEGADFLGYFTQKNASGVQYYDADGKGVYMPSSSEDVVLYAAFGYKIIYELNDGKNDSANPDFYLVDTEITLKDASKKGYTFDGWYDAQTGGNKVTVISAGNTGDITLWARWGGVNTPTESEYTVQHLFQKTSGGTEENDYETNDELASDETKNGTVGELTSAQAKTIAGFEAVTPITQKTIEADGATTVTIKYNRKTINYTFAPNGGNWEGSTESKTLSALYGVAVTTPENPSRDGYTFTGWTPSVPNTYGTTDATFTAEWTEDVPDTYSVTVTGGIASPSSASSGTEITLTADEPTTGKKFKNWTSEDGISFEDANSSSTTFTMLEKNVSVMANFEFITYTVSFNANTENDVTGSMTNQDFTYGTAQSLTANTFTRNGYTFTGWNTQSDGSGTSYADGEEVNNLTASDGATVTLYAKWTENPETGVSVTFTVPEYSDVDLAFTASFNSGTNNINFSAASGYSQYQWYIEGSQIGSDSSNSFTLDVSNVEIYPCGIYSAMLVVLTGGSEYYSATMQVTITR